MLERIQSVSELAVRVAKDPDLWEKIKLAPAETLADLGRPLDWDKWIYRSVVWALGAALVITIIGAIILALNGKALPEGIIAVGSASAGALAGLLAPSPTPK